MPMLNFTSKDAKSFAKKYAAKLEEKAAKVVPTPFSLDFEEVEKQIVLTLKDNYVVNHNFIYRGNYDEFVTIYEEKFPDGCKLDNKGRVILD